ncbi:hypothetical protein [Hoeflea sp.]|uniref:DUF7662 domain-containing protein n=1 Tax=Hoeflea sp. TaxID=1940281 RepID=UPI0025C663A3|nr:hypothetical protein [Hoeflea sp.]MBU4528556.1 hypothetical protein [Alphaproteobacteria bacterium]MBU4545639.1 hypothetical protein [Alphaproteobacteria bacterium]MBU4552249.1 hypothetical protein [Alphaproteobacteria bacterium]
MTKYEPLSDYLKSSDHDRVPMTFNELEKLIDDTLPPSARKHRAWWSNNPSNSVITRAWLDAGYITRDVDLGGEKLVFRRAPQPELAESKNGSEAGSRDQKIAGGRSIFGCMKGTLTIPPGVDLTEPADPDWGKVYEDG